MKRRILLFAVPAALLFGACADGPMEPSLDVATAPSFALAGGSGGPSVMAAAATVVIDFESLASAGSDVTYVRNYSQDGFTVVNATNPENDYSFGSPQTSNVDYEGSATLLNNTPNAVTVLTKDDGGAFTVLSIDLAEWRSISSVSRSVPFTGTRADGTTVSVTFHTDGVLGLETFTFDGFTDLTSLSWVQVKPFHQFDDITISLGPVGPVDPVSKDDCKNSGWESFGFENQGQCVRFVETDKDSR